MNEEIYQKAYNYATYLLSIRLRTEGELAEKLKGKGYNSNIIDKIVADFKGLSYLDDERFALIFLDNLKKYKYFGFYGVKKKLIEKRLPRNLIDRVLEENFPVEDELVIARKFLKKGNVDVSKKLPLPAKQKAAQRLQSRGFRGEVISKLIFR